MDPSHVTGSLIIVASSFQLVGLIILSYFSVNTCRAEYLTLLECVHDSFMIFLIKFLHEHEKIVWILSMISAETSYMTYMQKLAPDIQAWLKSLYNDYTERTAIYYYRNNATEGETNFNATVIVRSRVGHSLKTINYIFSSLSTTFTKNSNAVAGAPILT